MGMVSGFSASILWALAQVTDMALAAYMWCFIISALLTWVQPNPHNPLVRFLRQVTEPVLFRLRQRLPFLWSGGIDFSPMAVILIIYFVRLVVGNTARQLIGMSAAGLAW